MVKGQVKGLTWDRRTGTGVGRAGRRPARPRVLGGPGGGLQF